MIPGGARAILQTLADNGVDVCFTNPGTSELHLVAALDATPEIRPVLALFEGVATGAADGYARMTGRTAATLLHLGPGLANGLANLHNARRAGSPILNLVGDHATDHRDNDPPLHSDIATLATPMSNWVGAVSTPESAGSETAEALSATRDRAGQVATLTIPADVAWAREATVGPVVAPALGKAPDAATVETAASLLTGPEAALLLDGAALYEPLLSVAARIQQKTGCRLLSPTLTARVRRGIDCPVVERIPYFPQQAIPALSTLSSVVTIHAAAPVSFFAYPEQPRRLLQDSTQVLELASRDHDAATALEALAERVGAAKSLSVATLTSAAGSRPVGELTLEMLGQVVASRLPEDAVLVDEAVSSGLALGPALATAPAHDWLGQVGGSIGQGLPLAIGAACACPERPVYVLQADGSAMYTLQALWTMAREKLDVVIAVIANRRYAILEAEMAAIAPQSLAAKRLVDLSDPELDFVAMARGLGVAACSVETAEDLDRALVNAEAADGPQLIEARVSGGLPT